MPPELVFDAVEVIEVDPDAEVEALAVLTTIEVTKGLMSFEVDELARMFRRYEPGLIVLGTVRVACPLEPVVVELLYTMEPPLRKMYATVAPPAGLDWVGAPSGVWTVVTVMVLPGLTTGGIVACGLRTSAGAKRLASAWVPAAKSGFGFITRKAGELEEEYWET